MNTLSFDFCGSQVSWTFKKLSHLSDSSILAKWGDTVLNVSVLRGPAQESATFFPLQVEYVEKDYAAGKIASSPYIKREGFPSEEAILRGRMIDRAIRPRFPKGMLDNVQVFITVLSYDNEHDPLLLGFNTVVTALMSSSLPFEGQMAGLRVSLDDENKPYLNTRDVTALSYSANEDFPKMNMVIAVDNEGVVMFDADMGEIPEDKVIESVEFAKEQAAEMYKAQVKFSESVKQEKISGTMFIVPPEIEAEVEKEKDAIIAGLKLESGEFHRSTEAVVKRVSEVLEKKEIEFTVAQIKEAIDHIQKDAIRSALLVDGKRFSSRDVDEIRELSAEVGLLPRAHGSGLFQRGNTHVLSVVTLASPGKQQVVEDMTGEDVRMYIHDYSNLPYANGEPGRVSYHPGRREVGHGALAEKAVIRMLPSQEEFPYMIRVVSEIMSSAGSTSMASTCGSILALMDAGVPIKKPVAGISIGLMSTEDYSKYYLLTDIADMEDFYGEMDFKVAGTKDGITAIQMDQKRLRVPYKIIFEAFGKALVARSKVFEVMLATIPTPKKEMSQYAPLIESMHIDPENIGKLIGPGGKVIKELSRVTGMEINIQDDGTVDIFGAGLENRMKAKDMIMNLFDDFKVGEVYEGIIQELKAFGATCKIFKGNLDGKGLIHISELSNEFVKNVEEVVKPGQKVKVKLIGFDEQGRLRLSLKQVE